MLQTFTTEFELVGEKELLYNILPKLGACHSQLINLTFFNAFLIRSEVFKFSWACLIIDKVLRLFGLKNEIKEEIFFFSCFFTFINLFWGIFKALFIPAFMILSGQSSSSRSVYSSFNLIYFK